MALNLGKRFIDYLQVNSGRSFTAQEVAQCVFEHFPKECAEKKAASSYLTTDDELVQLLVAEISGSRPRWQKMRPKLKTARTCGLSCG